MEKGTIGKIQLLGGIILLLIGILALISIYYFGNSFVKVTNTNPTNDSVLYRVNIVEESMITSSYINWYAFSFVMIISSLIFIAHREINTKQIK